MSPPQSPRSNNLHPASVQVLAEQILSLRERTDEDRENRKTEREADEKRYVSKSDLLPIKLIVYGLAGTILSSALYSLLSLILPHVK